MHAALRPYDSLGRYDGTTFLMVLPHCTTSGALEVAGRARIAVAAYPFETDAGQVLASISIGIATTTGENEITLRGLLQLAQNAVERAKRHGGNRVELPTDYDAPT